MAEANEKLVDYIPKLIREKRAILMDLKNQRIDFGQYTEHQ